MKKLILIFLLISCNSSKGIKEKFIYNECASYGKDSVLTFNGITVYQVKPVFDKTDEEGNDGGTGFKVGADGLSYQMGYYHNKGHLEKRLKEDPAYLASYISQIIAFFITEHYYTKKGFFNYRNIIIKIENNTVTGLFKGVTIIKKVDYPDMPYRHEDIVRHVIDLLIEPHIIKLWIEANPKAEVFKTIRRDNIFKHKSITVDVIKTKHILDKKITYFIEGIRKNDGRTYTERMLINPKQNSEEVLNIIPNLFRSNFYPLIQDYLNKGKGIFKGNNISITIENSVIIGKRDSLIITRSLKNKKYLKIRTSLKYVILELYKEI